MISSLFGLGNKPPKLDGDKISEISSEVSSLFSKEFSIAYKDIVEEKIKAENSDKQLSSSSLYKLLTAPPADQFLKSGYLIKLGGQVHNWKRRYFIAMNEADGYSILYSETEQSSTVKGKFYCHGFTVVPFTKEEITLYGIYGMKLIPPDPTKRKWFVRAKTLQEYKEWFEVFSNACRKSISNAEADALKSKAFQSAYRNTRAAYGLYGFPNRYGYEIDMLETLTFMIVKREILDPYLTAISALKSKKKLADDVDHNDVATATAMMKLSPIVNSFWRECLQSVAVMATSFESSFIPILEAFKTAESAFIESVRSRVNELCHSVLHDAKQKFFKPILDKIFSPLSEAYKSAIVEVMKAIRPTIDTISEKPDNLSQEISSIDGSLEQIDSGPLAGAQVILRQLTIEGISGFEAYFTQTNLSSFDVYLTMMESVRKLSRNALHSYSNNTQAAMGSLGPDSPAITPESRMTPKRDSVRASFLFDGNEKTPSPLVKQSSLLNAKSPQVNPLTKRRQSILLTPAQIKPKLIESYNLILSLFCEDAVVDIRMSLSMLFLNLIEPYVQERVIIPCIELATQYTSKIPKTLVPFMSCSAIIERVIRKVIEDEIFATILESKFDVQNDIYSVIPAELLQTE